MFSTGTRTKYIPIVHKPRLGLYFCGWPLDRKDTCDMADEKTTIKEMIDCVADFEKARDWAQFHAPKNLAMGLAIETGELMEHFQWISEDDSRKVVDDPQTMTQVKEEMADVFCYLLTMANTMGIDLSEAFYEKMKRNNQKYTADKYYGKYKL